MLLSQSITSWQYIATCLSELKDNQQTVLSSQSEITTPLHCPSGTLCCSQQQFMGEGSGGDSGGHRSPSPTVAQPSSCLKMLCGTECYAPLLSQHSTVSAGTASLLQRGLQHHSTKEHTLPLSWKSQVYITLFGSFRLSRMLFPVIRTQHCPEDTQQLSFSYYFLYDQPMGKAAP